MLINKGLVTVALLWLGGALAYGQAPIGKTNAVPLDGIVEKKLLNERHLLDYEPVREGDVLWEKKVWRVIDVREKMNLPFAYAERPFFTLLNDAVQKGQVTAYATENDKFTKALSIEQANGMTAKWDTVTIFDPITLDEKIMPVRNEIDHEDIKQFRIKEVWYFDKRTSSIKTKILGIAPIIEEFDKNGDFRFARPLYWVYYPDCRGYLSHQEVFNFAGNDAAPTSWEDLLEQRFFSSYITKESNVYDRRIEDYLTGVDALLEGDKIHREIFHSEDDLWSY